MLLVLGLGGFVWQNGFGVLATERKLEWRVPVAYADIRAVDLQLWRGDELLKREERTFANGVAAALENSVPLTRGAHRAVAVVTMRDGSINTYTTQVDPEAHGLVAVVFAHSDKRSMAR